MAAALESTTKRYIGLSSDVKPDNAEATAGTPVVRVPAGSSFLETDTWRISRFDGNEWRYERSDDQVVELLREMLIEMRSLKEALEVLSSKV